MEASKPAENNRPVNKPGRVIEIGDLAERIRWRRYILSRAASNSYLESPQYAA